MEVILVLLIIALLNGALFFIDGILESIVPIALNAENYMGTLLGSDWFGTVYSIFFAFGISVIVLKFLKKGFDTYIGWMDGNPDADPLELVTNFLRAIAVAICFPVMYGWMVNIVTTLTDQLLTAIGVGMQMDFAGLIAGLATAGLFTALLSLVFFVFFFILYIQFLGRGLEILILRTGMPFACVGLLDNDKGVFGAYIKKFFQSTLAVVIQISLLKMGVGFMLNMHPLWAIAAMMLALKTPKFLQEFILPYSGGVGMNTIYHTSRIVQMIKSIGKSAAKGGS